MKATHGTIIELIGEMAFNLCENEYGDFIKWLSDFARTYTG